MESCNGDRQSPIDIQTHLASLISHPKIDFAFEGQCFKSGLISEFGTQFNPKSGLPTLCQTMTIS